MTRTAFHSAAYCLHSRPYRETSAIVYLFARDAGKVSAVVKGVKSAGRQRRNPLATLQPFTPLQVSWLGNGELKTLTSMEIEKPAMALQGRALFAGLYLNELLNTLLVDQQEHSELYQAYEATLKHLAEYDSLELALRRFEYFLLEQLGYGLMFDVVDELGAHSGKLLASGYYRYIPESGFIAASALAITVHQHDVFLGEDLHKIAIGQLDSPDVLLVAKRLMRLALSTVLGAKVLNSRQLFV